MIRADEQGNIYILSDNSGYFRIQGLPNVSGKLDITFYGDMEVKKEFDVNGQQEVIVKLSRKDIEDIGVGVHQWIADLIHGDEKDTIVYQTITVIEKEV